MRKYVPNAWVLVLAAATTATPSTKPDMTPRVMEGGVVEKDVAYGRAEKQKLDLYAPPAGKGMPVLVFVHGGEWTKGIKAEVSFKPKFFDEHGVVFVSINYRLSGTDRHPAQVRDVCSALKWSSEHVREYGGDPGNIVLMGHSAGCQLVTLVGLEGKDHTGANHEVGMKRDHSGEILLKFIGR